MINVLLTGAGFTANFGSPLAKEIYNLLFNTQQVQSEKEIKKLFLSDENIKNSNYENIYEQILTSKLEEKSKKEFNKLLWTTFLQNVDCFSTSPQWTNLAGLKPQDYLLEKFLIKFICSKNKSIFFSLNQDLFIERQSTRLFKDYQPDENSHINSKLSSMGMNDHPSRNLKRLGVLDIITTKNIHTPLEGDLIQSIGEKQKNNAENEFTDWLTKDTDFTYYLKLHGSLDYYYDGMPLFITGENKSGRIASCPLTKFYSAVFESILKDNNCKLIIIGYGFQDEHINKIISTFLIKSCEEDEIHIVDNIDLKNFLKNVAGKIDICNLKSKLKSYHPNGLNARTLASFIEPNLLELE